MNIDWSKAPEGATHYYKNSPQPWRDLSGYNWKYFSSGEWHSGPSVCTSDELMREIGKVLFAKPLAQPWTGEGPPPVGLACEVVSPGYSSPRFDRFIGQVVTVVAHDVIDGVPVAVFRMAVDGQVDEQDYHAMVAKCFKPARTPEQIAAEAEAKELETLQRELEHWALVTFQLGPKELAEKLMKSGYRKQVKP